MPESSFSFVISLLVLISSWQAIALPIGFGRGQGDLEYSELATENFYVYFDKRTPQEGQAISNALEAGLGPIQDWFGIQRQSRLPVVLSSTTSNPSFANFITDALELQTMGRGGRDLAWHELSHNIMYRHLDNFFGPVGNILHLPWMPAWWLEGLAEATSHSLGSDSIYSIERYAALSDSWPSYAKLHSLYSGSFSYLGYGISGGFVSFILRTYGADKLKPIMEDFFQYTLPWWWPWSMVPFNDFMPMDAALVKHTGKTGEELYQEYQRTAKAFWSQQDLPPLLKDHYTQLPKLPSHPPAKAGSRGKAWSLSALQLRGDRLFNVNYFEDDHKNYETELILSEHGNKNALPKKRSSLPENSANARITYGPKPVFAISYTDENFEPHSTLVTGHSNKTRERLLRRAWIERLALGPQHIFWLESHGNNSRLCYLPRNLFFSGKAINASMVKCPLEETYPVQLQFLGENFSPDGNSIETLWFRRSTETLYGDRYEILQLDTYPLKLKKVANYLSGKPISMAEGNNRQYLLLADHRSQFIRVFSGGRCLHELLTANHLEQILASDNALYAVSREGTDRWIYKRSPESWQKRSCRSSTLPSSPLLIKMLYPQASFAQALHAVNPWRNYEGRNRFVKQSVAEKKPLHLATDKPAKVRPANWRGRPVFAFPWIGADAKGYQLGAITVPLMDHMQNETIALTALYGLYSQFPDLSVSIDSSRFLTHLSTSIFRRQAWNGSFRGDIYYFDERGIELNARRYFHTFGLGIRAGLRGVDRLPYIGDPAIWPFAAQGEAIEVEASIDKSIAIGESTLRLSLFAKSAPEEYNENFIYDKLAIASNYSLPISLLGIDSSQLFGLNYSRTRGKRRPLLREVYRPLKTFVPGSGGGFNEINVGLSGPGLLTSAIYGDTQARFNWAWTFPLVKDLETLIHIFYLERLDFTAFYNYGYAWNQNIAPRGKDFLQAHGYNLDLQSDIKGVTVNLGLGTGQVFNADWESYILFGFDALINP